MTYRFIGYAIVSEDGMLADASGAIPPALIVKADQEFFMRGLDAAAALIHGRNSAEQPTSPARRRLIATRKIETLAPVEGEPHALHWNPEGASVEVALHALGVTGGDIAIIGGTDIFGLFLPRYDLFHLTRAQHVTLPGGPPGLSRNAGTDAGSGAGGGRLDARRTANTGPRPGCQRRNVAEKTHCLVW